MEFKTVMTTTNLKEEYEKIKLKESE